MARAKLAEKLREKQAKDQGERQRKARKARRQPGGRQGYHRLELNPDGTYRCVTCLRGGTQ